jgi:predicted RNA-binding Zn-ribbon protein involved in translation (DUF1610 family)
MVRIDSGPADGVAVNPDSPSPYACPVCGQTLVAVTPAVLPPGGEVRELARRINCPNCGQHMLTVWYYGPGRVVIDRCEPCGLVWLDGGELQRVIDAPGPDRLA